MCGRFTLRTPAKDIAEIFSLAEVPDLRPRYNIAPTQPVAAVRLDKQAHRELVMLHREWLSCSWLKP
jgi:putative SOS response-associated peptidase YedK